MTRQYCPLTYSYEGGFQACSPNCAWIVGDTCALKLLVLRADDLIEEYVEERNQNSVRSCLD